MLLDEVPVWSQELVGIKWLSTLDLLLSEWNAKSELHESNYIFWDSGRDKMHFTPH